MTRKRLMQIAECAGLVLAVERVVTGWANGPAFRTFEFTGPLPKLASALDSIRQEWDSKFATIRISDIDGKPYLEVDSFWCEPAEVVA